VTSKRLSRAGLLIACAVGAGGCVDNFNGSKIELFFHGGVQIPGDDPRGDGRPPSDTHYELYAVKGDGVFHLADFDIRPVILMSDPCFIEEKGSRFAGLHSTKIVEKLTEAAMADGTVSDQEAGDIALARVRVGNMLLLQESLKVVSLHEPGLTNAKIAEATAQVPAADLIDDASNAARLAACTAAWKAYPGYYVATDKVLTIPLNGTYYGLVEGQDPRNGGLLGGGQISSDVSIKDFDALRVNWNFNDPNDPRKGPLSPSNIGWHYMAGKAVQRARGVYNVTVVNQDFGQIRGEMAVFTDLGNDDVHF
jgi:hypothetical protein